MVKEKPKAKNKDEAYEQKFVEAYKKVAEYKENCEANIVATFFKQPDLMFGYDLKLEDFSHNAWRVYWQIAYDIVIKEGKSKKTSLDEITIGFYLEKHKKLKEKYDEYGGFGTVIKSTEYIKTENLDGYIRELHKWNAVVNLLKNKFPVYDRLSEFADMTVDEVYAEYEAILNHIFINADDEIHTYSIDENLDELIEELDKGAAVGLPYANMPMFNKETGGQMIGNITLIGGLSNVGKSTLARSITIPSIISNKEKLVIMLNEENQKKWQRELLVWVANNIYKDDLQKFVVRDGKYTPEVKEILHKSKQWIEENASNHTITIIPFKSYKTEMAIKVIKKYASLGVKYFILDTFKADSGSRSDKAWLDMQQAMVDINDTVKPEVKNVHIMITFQLSKYSSRQRFYTQDNIGMAKNIIDPVSTCIMVRDLFDDEYTGEKNALKVYRLDGKNGKTKVPVTLVPEKRYQVIFIVKNREGAANQFQIVCEHDMSRNILKEVGITSVPVDF